jgi:hypothetical protein
MVSFRRAPDALELRVHRMFVDAEPEVVQALADYARAQSPGSSRVLDRFVRKNREAIRPRESALKSPLQHRGAAHNLLDIFDALNARYFSGEIQARIGWGRGAGARERQSMRMGAYLQESRTILINPALDSSKVPRYFVELVVYHEMLHQAVPQQRSRTGRRAVHSREFKSRESQFADFDRAKAWERQNVNQLLRPKPLPG